MVQDCSNTFLADNHHHYLYGRAMTWLAENGSEFFEKSLYAPSQVSRPPQVHRAVQPADQSCRSQRVSSLLPRPCRNCIAASNVSEWLLSWSINQIVSIHNVLVIKHSTAIARKTPYEMKTGTQPQVDIFGTLFCSATSYLRGKAQEPSKLAP
eukprot:4833880-Pleurochrysis_carterae.AAC.8